MSRSIELYEHSNKVGYVVKMIGTRYSQFRYLLFFSSFREKETGVRMKRLSSEFETSKFMKSYRIHI